MFNSLNFIIFKVPNLLDGEVWYEQVLKVKPYLKNSYYVGFKIGETTEIGLQKGSVEMEHKINPIDDPCPFFHVGDLYKTKEELIELGAEMEHDIMSVSEGYRIVRFYDPFGNLFGIVNVEK